jgi:hypothetical protein
MRAVKDDGIENTLADLIDQPPRQPDLNPVCESGCSLSPQEQIHERVHAGTHGHVSNARAVGSLHEIPRCRHLEKSCDKHDALKVSTWLLGISYEKFCISCSILFLLLIVRVDGTSRCTLKSQKEIANVNQTAGSA